MSDYVKRKDVIDFIRSYRHSTDVAFHMEERLDEVPAADVVEQKHGKWIWDDEGYHCSECFFHAYGNTGEILSGVYNFCPNCGTAMEGDSDV